MTSALKWALATSIVTVAVMAGALAAVVDPAQRSPWVRGTVLVAGLGVPVAGGVVTAMRGARDRRQGASPGQTRLALGLAVALITLGVGLLLAISSVQY